MTKHKKKQPKPKDKPAQESQKKPNKKKLDALAGLGIAKQAKDFYNSLPEDSDIENLLEDHKVPFEEFDANFELKDHHIDLDESEPLELLADNNDADYNDPEEEVSGEYEVSSTVGKHINPPASSHEQSKPLSAPSPEGELANLLLETLEKANKPLKMDSILRTIHLPRSGKEDLETTLYSLQEKGLLVRIKGSWSVTSRLKQSKGILQMQKIGVGFVLQDKLGTKDIFIHPTHLGDALHGDLVQVVLLPVPKGAKPEGRIIAVLERSTQEQGVIAQKLQRDGTWICSPSNQRVQTLFSVDITDLTTPVRQGDLLLVSVLGKKGLGIFSAKATANLASEENPKAQERLGKSNHNIPTEFPQGAIKQAQDLPKDPSEADFENRKDLRHLDFVTIDGEDAKDFDDAIYVEELRNPELNLPPKSGKFIPQGQNPKTATYRLMVAIADVSHYVPLGSELDVTATMRGNSYYFPLSVEPMFPEALSNGLCSLRPDVPRLVMVADMLYTSEANFVGASFYPAVITSKARLTYDQVKAAVLENVPAEQAKIAHVLPMLQKAHALALQIAKTRTQRGSLDFDLPEAKINISEQGIITSISPKERHFGHQLIEEFMVAANEAVASFLTAENLAVLYRIHPQPSPEKLTALLGFLGQTGLVDEVISDILAKQKKKATPLSASTLQKVMDKVAQTPKAYTINRMILRSMMQAKYSTENEEHFGLASTCYCHFTSPIRRYADLMVHRNLKACMGVKGYAPISAASLEQVAGHINTTERNAIEAEREVQKRLTILYLKDKVGEIYQGVISGVTDFGMFIELPTMLVEGMVRLASLTDDYYELNKERQELRGRHTGRCFALGQNLEVLLEEVSLDRLEINLVITENNLGLARQGKLGRGNTSGRDGASRPTSASGHGDRTEQKPNSAPRGRRGTGDKPESGTKVKRGARDRKASPDKKKHRKGK